MWKPEHRATADRRGLRYASHLTDAEWALVAPSICLAKRGGRPRTVNVRDVLNAIFYVLWTGCQWKAYPKYLPPRSTAAEYLNLWDWDGTLERHPPRRPPSRCGRTLVRGEPDDGDHRQRDRQGCRQGELSLDASGYDAGKKVLGRKRHVLTDTIGLLLAVHVHPASVHDGECAEALLREAGRSSLFIERHHRRRRLSRAKNASRCRLHRQLAAFTSCAAATGTGSLCRRKDGPWSAPWPGSAAVVGWHVTTSVMLARLAVFVRVCNHPSHAPAPRRNAFIRNDTSRRGL